MGMLPPQKWAPYPEALIAPAALDVTLAALAHIHPTGKRSLSEGMVRVIAVGGRLTAPQVDLLRGVCMVVDCPVPLIPDDVVFEEADVLAPKAMARRARRLRPARDRAFANPRTAGTRRTPATGGGGSKHARHVRRASR